MKLALILLLASYASAQEGHPLVGSWHGSWGTSPTQQTDATFVLKWDGKEISGLINPGLEVIKITKASLDAPTWTVHFEGETKDATGKPVHIEVDGKIEHVTNVRRRIVGTWSQSTAQGTTKAALKMTHDD
jgi:hypothetical protein